MPNRIAQRWSLVFVLTAVALASAACSQGGPTQSPVSPAVVSHFKGFPKGGHLFACEPRFQVQKSCAAWAHNRSIYVITWGSGSCPNIPTSVIGRSAREVVISTVEHDFIKGDQACTADLAVTTSVVRLPAETNGAQALFVQIDGMRTRLPARSSS